MKKCDTVGLKIFKTIGRSWCEVDITPEAKLKQKEREVEILIVKKCE